VTLGHVLVGTCEVRHRLCCWNLGKTDQKAVIMNPAYYTSNFGRSVNFSLLGNFTEIFGFVKKVDRYYPNIYKKLIVERLE
jgi:hypothetical protein